MVRVGVIIFIVVFVLPVFLYSLRYMFRLPQEDWRDQILEGEK